MVPPVGTVLMMPDPRRTFRIQQIGGGDVLMDGVWYRQTQVKRWLKTGVLVIQASEEKCDGDLREEA